MRSGMRKISIPNSDFSLISTKSGSTGERYRFRSNNNISLTGRSFSSYHEAMQEQHGIDLKSLVEDNLDKHWLEVGAGVAEFIPLLAQKQKRNDGPKPTIIDPVNYAGILTFVKQIREDEGNCEFALGGIPIFADDLIQRLTVLTNPEYVTHHAYTFQNTPESIRNTFSRRFFAIIDHCAASLYAEKNETLDYAPFITADGHILINKFYFSEEDFSRWLRRC